MDTHFNRIRSTNGFSISELVVGLGILAIIISISMTMSFYVLKDNKTSSKRADTLMVITEIQNLLSNTDICTCIIKGQTFNPSDAKSKISLDSIRQGCDVNSTILAKKYVATAASSTAAVLFEDIVISQFTPSGNPNEFNAKLSLVPLKSKDSSPQYQQSSLIVRFNTVPGVAKIKTINSCGSSSLEAPKSLFALSGSGACDLSWLASVGGSGAKKYFVKYGTTPVNLENGLLGCLPYSITDSCQVTGLNNGQTYYFIVQAKTETEISTFSSIASCTPSTVPLPPQNITAISNAASTCSISWENTEAEDLLSPTYRIYKATNFGGSSKGTLACQTKNKFCNAVGLQTSTKKSPGPKYYFSGTSTTKFGTSVFSIPEADCTPAVAPDSPVQNITEPYNNYCNLSWSESLKGDDPTVYTVFDSAKNTPVLGCTDLEVNQCGVGNLINGTTYTFYIEAKNKFGSAKSNIQSCVPKDNTLAEEE